MVQELLKAGSNVNVVEQHCFTVLMEAARVGHLDLVQVLLEAGSDVNATTQNHITALKVAAFEGHNQVEALLVEAKDAKENGWQPEYHYFFPKEFKDAVEALMVRWERKEDEAIATLPLELIYQMIGEMAIKRGLCLANRYG